MAVDRLMPPSKARHRPGAQACLERRWLMPSRIWAQCVLLLLSLAALAATCAELTVGP